jgi:hypothetical protein
VILIDAPLSNLCPGLVAMIGLLLVASHLRVGVAPFADLPVQHQSANSRRSSRRDPLQFSEVYGRNKYEVPSNHAIPREHAGPYNAFGRAAYEDYCSLSRSGQPHYRTLRHSHPMN